MDLGAYLESEREKLKLSMRKFAKVLTISNGEYTKIVNRTHTPRLETLDKIAQKLHLSLPRVLELAGYDLQLNANTPTSDRLAALIQREPRLKTIAPLIAQLGLADQAAVLSKLEQDYPAE